MYQLNSVSDEILSQILACLAYVAPIIIAITSGITDKLRRTPNRDWAQIITIIVSISVSLLTWGYGQSIVEAFGVFKFWYQVVIFAFVASFFSNGVYDIERVKQLLILIGLRVPTTPVK